MGLDMYLTAKMGLYGYDKKKRKTQNRIKEIRRIFPEMWKSGNLDFINIEFEAGYWRKANQIHKWFVENVQDGEDDCGEYWVEREKLIKLMELCKEVIRKIKLKNGKIINGYSFKGGKEIPNLEDGKVVANLEIAKRLLPTQEGFFFGGTDYNEYYIDDLKRTIKIIEKCLKLPKEWNLYYRSSW